MGLIIISAYGLVLLGCLVVGIGISVNLKSEGLIKPSRFSFILYALLLLLSFPIIWIFIPVIPIITSWFISYSSEDVLHPVLEGGYLIPFLLNFAWLLGILLILRSKRWKPTEPRGRKVCFYVLLPCLLFLSLSQAIPGILIATSHNRLDYSAIDSSGEYELKVFVSPGKLGPVYKIWRFPNRWMTLTGVSLGDFYTNQVHEEVYFYFNDDFWEAEWRMEWPEEPDLLQLWKGEKRVFAFKNARLPVEDLIENRELYMIDVAAEAVEEATTINSTLSESIQIENATE